MSQPYLQCPNPEEWLGQVCPGQDPDNCSKFCDNSQRFEQCVLDSSSPIGYFCQIPQDGKCSVQYTNRAQCSPLNVDNGSRFMGCKPGFVQMWDHTKPAPDGRNLNEICQYTYDPHEIMKLVGFKILDDGKERTKQKTSANMNNSGPNPTYVEHVCHGPWNQPNGQTVTHWTGTLCADLQYDLNLGTKNNGGPFDAEGIVGGIGGGGVRCTMGLEAYGDEIRFVHSGNKDPTDFSTLSNLSNYYTGSVLNAAKDDLFSSYRQYNETTGNPGMNATGMNDGCDGGYCCTRGG